MVLKNRVVYDHGLPFSPVLADALDEQLRRIQSKKASLVIIEGGLGNGKTTLGVHCADYLNKKQSFPELPLAKDEPQVAMGGKQFVKKLSVCYDRKLPCIVYDEAGDFSKRGSLTMFNAQLNRIFETYRAFRMIVIICLPNFDKLDMSLMDNLIPRFMLRCFDKQPGYSNFKGYSLYRMDLLKAKMKQLKVKRYAYSVIDCNFQGHFLDLSAERSKRLDVLSTESKLKILKQTDAKMEGLLTTLDMATKLVRSLNWVYIALRNLKIKPLKQVSKVRYYDETTLTRLAQLIEDTEMGSTPKRKGGK